MRLEGKVAKLFNEQNIASVLDLGAGTGKWSIFSASYGSKVIAIDNQSKALWQFPEYLKSHPSITFLEADITDLNLSFHQGFDLILLFNVIVFMKKKFFLEKILPHYLEKLHIGGKLCLTFFFADDQTMGSNPKLSFYSFEDFKVPQGYRIAQQKEKTEQDHHAPYGEHQHHLGYVEIAKV